MKTTIDAVKSKIYMNEEVVNKNARKNALGSYLVAYITNVDGTVVPALFTHFDLDKAIRRAENNPEDVPPAYTQPKLHWFRRLFGGTR